MKRTLLAAAVASMITAGCGSTHSVAVVPTGADIQRNAIGIGQTIYTFHLFSGPAEDYHHQMTVGPDGNVWFRDSLSKKIGFITPTGSVTEYSLPQGHAVASGIAAGPDGNIWYTEGRNNSVGRVTMAGAVTVYKLPYNREPIDITGGADGNLWFTVKKPSSGPWWIGKITPTGTATFYPVPGLTANLNDITMGPDGNVWFADGGSRTIGRVTPSGAITEFNVPNGITPNGIVRAADNALYTAAKGSVGTFVRITPSGSISVIVDPGNANQFDVIAEGPKHCIWGSRACANGVGECLDLFNVTHHGFHEHRFPTSVSALAGLVAGADGNIWFQVYSTGNIPEGLGKLNAY